MLRQRGIEAEGMGDAREGKSEVSRMRSLF